jgi:hypothetical protein
VVRLNPFARRREQIGATIVASARKIQLGKPDDVKKWIRKPEEWQKWAWVYYDLLGQVKYGVNFLANAASKVRLYVAVVDPGKPNDDPKAVTTGQAIEALDQLRDGLGSHSELLRKAVINLSVPGEWYLIGFQERTEMQHEDPNDILSPLVEVITLEETWGIYSTEEVTVDSIGKVKVRPGGEEGTDAKEIVLDDENDFILRVWIPHARFSNQPDSPVHGVLGDCEDMVDLRKMMRASDRSRVGAGMLLWPTEETMGPADRSTTPTEPGDERLDPVMKNLEDATISAIEDPDSPDRVAPTLSRVGAQHMDKIRHLKFGREITAQDLQRWDMLVNSFEQGINLPVGAVTGVKDVNHWSAWQIDESTFTGHVEPLILVLCASLTTGYLRPWLTDPDGGGMSEEQASNYVIWYDPEALVADPDPAKTAGEAFDRDAISYKAYRRIAGFLEDDAPSDEELAMRLGIKRGTTDAGVVLSLLRWLVPQLEAAEPATDTTPPAPGDSPPPAGDNPPADGPPEGDKPDAGPPEGARAIEAAAVPKRAARNLGSRLRSIDTSLRLMLQGSWHAAMKRALERASAKALSTLPRSVRRELGLNGGTLDVFTALRGRLEEFGLSEDRLLENAFAGLGEEFDQWVRHAQEQALNLVPRLQGHERARALEEMARSRQSAWEFASTALMSLARGKLYDPAPDAPALGEQAAGVLVPFGLIREAVARSGGATEPGAWVGIGSGPTIMGMLGDKGVKPKGYVWMYGEFPRTSSFEPHAELDGLEFRNFDDEQLANNEGWPAVSYFMPGDHDGCMCDFEQAFEDAGAVAA